MLLIDTILNSRNHTIGRQSSELTQHLRAAQKFVLEKDFALAADSVPDTEIDRVIKYARPPFDTAWFEVAASYRGRFTSIPTEPGTMRPQRVGILLQANLDDFEQFTTNLFWSFDKHGFEHCPIAMTASLGETFDYENFRMKNGSRLPQAHFMRHFVPTGSTFSMVDSEDSQETYNRHFANWGGEVEFWSSVLALLSCKNAATIEAIKRSDTVQLASRKILSDHNICRIRIPDLNRASSDAADSEAAIRLHFVRGHFKRRKNGLFWWSPFIRGDKSLGFVAKDYVVQGGALSS